jgi:actin-like ATPase involved in cell morphogenesis
MEEFTPNDCLERAKESLRKYCSREIAALEEAKAAKIGANANTARR